MKTPATRSLACGGGGPQPGSKGSSRARVHTHTPPSPAAVATLGSSSASRIPTPPGTFESRSGVCCEIVEMVTAISVYENALSLTQSVTSGSYQPSDIFWAFNLDMLACRPLLLWTCADDLMLPLVGAPTGSPAPRANRTLVRGSLARRDCAYPYTAPDARSRQRHRRDSPESPARQGRVEKTTSQT